jgi:hypothetical protein
MNYSIQCQSLNHSVMKRLASVLLLSTCGLLGLTYSCQYFNASSALPTGTNPVDMQAIAESTGLSSSVDRDFEMAFGLQHGQDLSRTFFKDKAQTFQIECSRDQYVQGLNGLTVFCPTGCFIDAQKKAVKGMVELTVVEASTIKDYAQLCLTNEVCDKPTIMDAAFYISAAQGGKQLGISKTKPLVVKVSKSLIADAAYYWAKPGEKGLQTWTTLAREKMTQAFPYQAPSESGLVDKSAALASFETYSQIHGKMKSGATAMYRDIKLFSEDTARVYGNKHYPFDSEAEVLGAKERISFLEKAQGAVFQNGSKTYTRKSDVAALATRLSGTPIPPIRLSSARILTRDQAIFFDITAAQPQALLFHEVVKDYKPVAETRKNILEMEAMTKQLAQLYKSAPSTTEEADILKAYQKQSMSMSPVAFRWGGQFIVSKKYIGQLFPTTGSYKAAQLAQWISEIKSGSDDLKGKMVDASSLVEPLTILMSQLSQKATLKRIPKDVSFHHLAATLTSIAYPEEPKIEYEKAVREYYWHQDRFYVSKELLVALIARGSDVDVKPVMDLMTQSYKPAPFKNKFLKSDYIDMTDAVQWVSSYASAGELDEQIASVKTEQSDYKDQQLSLERQKQSHYEDYDFIKIEQMGWYSKQRQVSEPVFTYTGSISGTTQPVIIHVISQQDRTHMVYKVKDGAFSFQLPDERTIQLIAVVGDKAVRLEQYIVKSQSYVGDIDLTQQEKTSARELISSI